MSRRCLLDGSRFGGGDDPRGRSVGLVRRRSLVDSQSPNNPAAEDLNAGRRRVRV